MRDIYSSLAAEAAITPAVKSAAEDGAAIDLKGFNSALLVVNTGAIVGSGDFSFKLQESDASGSGFTDVVAADLIGTPPATMAASTAYRVGYVGSKRKRYIRISLTKAGGTSIAVGAIAIKGHANLQPLA